MDFWPIRARVESLNYIIKKHALRAEHHPVIKAVM